LAVDGKVIDEDSASLIDNAAGGGFWLATASRAAPDRRTRRRKWLSRPRRSLAIG
jgi:hypothetical protein